MRLAIFALLLALLFPGPACAQQAPPFPLRLLTSLYVPQPAGGQADGGRQTAAQPGPSFNATVLLQFPGATAGKGKQVRAVQMYVDGAKALAHHGKSIQIERYDLGRIWLLDIAGRTVLDMPLAQDRLPPSAVLRRHVAITVEGEEEWEGVETIKARVRMPAVLVESDLLPAESEGDMVEMLVWYAPSLGVFVKREGPGDAAMTMAHIQHGPQSSELFMIPDGYRAAGPPASFSQ